MDKSNVAIILPKHGWMHRYIKELGYTINDPYYGSNIAARILREIHFRMNLPGKTIWFNKQNILKKENIVVYEPLMIPEYLLWLKNKNPNSNIILLYANKVNVSISPDKCQSVIDAFWTFDKDDASRYNMHLYNGGGYFPQWKTQKKDIEYDVFYVGKDKGRLDYLRRIEDKFNAQGIKSLFWITWARGWQKRNDGIHRPFLPYEDILDYIGKSKAILHIKDGTQNGVTIRIQESLIHKVKLITDDLEISNYDFYNPNNIFILGKDSIDDLLVFLNTPYEDVDSSFFKHAHYDQMMEEIIGNSR